MSMTLREDKTILIEEYTLKDFVLSIQKAVQAGYEVSLENHNYPQGFSGHFTVGMVDMKEQPNTSTETAQTSDSSVIGDKGGTNVPETTKDAVNEPTEGSTEVSSAIKTPTKRGVKK